MADIAVTGMNVMPLTDVSFLNANLHGTFCPILFSYRSGVDDRRDGMTPKPGPDKSRFPNNPSRDNIGQFCLVLSGYWFIGVDVGLCLTCSFVSFTGNRPDSQECNSRAAGEISTLRPDSQFPVFTIRYRIVHVSSSK